MTPGARADVTARLLLCSAEGVTPAAAEHDDTIAVDLDRLHGGSWKLPVRQSRSTTRSVEPGSAKARRGPVGRFYR